MLIEKSRSGVYQDTSENRRLHRVGQRYGEAKKSEEKKGSGNVKGAEIATSKAGIKAFLSGKIGSDYYKAVAEAYKAVKESGKSMSVGLMLKESGSGSPSKDIPAKKYVEAVNDGATHDEAVEFANGCYEELLAKIQNVQEKVHNEGVNPSASTKMFAAVNKWFDAQKFEKKAVSESGVKKDEVKQGDVLPKVSLSERDFTRHVDEEAAEEYPNAKAKLHYYQADRVEYFNSEGQKRTAAPFITEFYSDGSQSGIGGYEVYFDKASSIGTFRTKESAIDALNKYVNAMRGKGRSESEKQVEKQSAKESIEKQEKPTSRVTFADVPRAKDVNLKKYLTDSRRKDVDRLMQTVDGMSSSAIKQAHDAAVKKFNDNFDNMKKSERASALYVIMKYKSLMNKSKSLDGKNKVMSEEDTKKKVRAFIKNGLDAAVDHAMKRFVDDFYGGKGEHLNASDYFSSGDFQEYLRERLPAGITTEDLKYATVSSINRGIERMKSSEREENYKVSKILAAKKAGASPEEAKAFTDKLYADTIGRADKAYEQALKKNPMSIDPDIKRQREDAVLTFLTTEFKKG